VEQALRLQAERAHDGRMAMPKQEGPEARSEIDIAIAVHVDHVRSRCRRIDDRILWSVDDHATPPARLGNRTHRGRVARTPGQPGTSATPMLIVTGMLSP